MCFHLSCQLMLIAKLRTEYVQTHFEFNVVNVVFFKLILNSATHTQIEK